MHAQQSGIDHHTLRYSKVLPPMISNLLNLAMLSVPLVAFRLAGAFLVILRLSGDTM